MPPQEELDKLAADVVQHAPHEAAELLVPQKDEDILAVLEVINPMVAQQVLGQFEEERRNQVLAAAPPDKAGQWVRNKQYPEDSIGWLMEPTVAVFRPQMTASETIAAMRKLTKRAFITYGYVTDESNKLVGVLVFRDVMLADPQKPLSEIMYSNIFSLRPDMALTDAMKATLNRHFPVYPVCDNEGRFLGLVRGQTLFEARAIELSAQAGTMVGVNEEERLATPVKRSFWMRHPWLQFNLLTAFIAAAVVGFFQGTLDKIVILAAFLPVLAGQSGNTGCQALAVTLRGLTLGDFKTGEERKLFFKEAVLGLLNGCLVGLVAGVGMYFYARMQPVVPDHIHPSPLMLGFIVWIAMISSCIVSGLSGATIPLVLKKFGFDPATASSIFLTTATDVVSMGTFLGLATWLML